MNLQSFEDQRSDAKQCYCKYPEICGGIKVFKEPLIPVNCISVSVHDIDKRIQLYQRDHLVIIYHPDIP